MSAPAGVVTVPPVQVEEPLYGRKKLSLILHSTGVEVVAVRGSEATLSVCTSGKPAAKALTAARRKDSFQTHPICSDAE